MPREQVRLRRVGVARQDERLDAHVLIAVQLGEDLIGVADDRGAAARAGAADAGPEIVLDIAVVGRCLAQRDLCVDAERLRVE